MLQEALDITTGFYKAMMAANYGDHSSNAAAISNSVSAALRAAAQAAAVAAANQTVQGQDGAPASSTDATAGTIGDGSILKRLRNMTRPIEVIARLRESTPNSGGLFRNAAGAAFAAAVNATDARRGALLNATQAPHERRNSVSLNIADQPATPSWLSTQEPGQTAGVYTR